MMRIFKVILRVETPKNFMIAGCVETTFRKLSGTEFGQSSYNSPITTETADHISRDWTNVFRYVSNHISCITTQETRAIF